ncbi:hypothetical protein [Bathymodiolus japonicus methanotrophic gill symbiont]|uniref:hypothetical protein n=1 Tax=Bathymodiolus japonicus methanotrophic gill symbiont TaxID=113269 RepID=UPI001C8E4284|nr:hypothetical protein [Bathymodiolus japonicus methanotrophic gill symbiont]
MHADASKKMRTAGAPSYGATTMTFTDSNIDPAFLASSPAANTSVVRNIKRTLKLNTKDISNSSISAFKYAVYSNRTILPGGAVTPNYPVVTNASGNYGDEYLMTVWTGNKPIADAVKASYGVMENQTNDKDMYIKFRKYRYKESIERYNSYFLW